MGRTASKLILNSAHLAINRRMTVIRTPGYCLALTRQVIEHALKLPYFGFYRHFVHKRVSPKHAGYWARDAHKSMHYRGWEVKKSSLAGGEILTNARVSRPYGHIGIYVGTVKIYRPNAGPLILRERVLENTDSWRGFRLGGAVALTPIDQFAPDQCFSVQDDYEAIVKKHGGRLTT